MLAGQIAEKLLARLPADATADAMFRILVDRLGTLADADSRRLASGLLQVLTPRIVGEQDEARYKQVLMVALPGLTEATFVTDPALIAGVDLDTLPHDLREGDPHARIS